MNSKSDSPNILFLIPEQCRRDFFGCYGGRADVTPNIDRLANGGVRFEHSYVPAPKCGPSRASVVTGRYPHIGGYMANAIRPGGESPNLVRAFKDAGYETFLYRKNHQISNDFLAECYDHYMAGKDIGGRNDEQYISSGSHPLRKMLYLGRNNVPVDETSDGQLAEEVARMIRQRPDDAPPFFVWVNFYQTHPGYKCSEPFFSRFKRDEIELPPKDDDPNKPEFLNELRKNWACDELTDEDWRELIATYLGMTCEMDYLVGRILDALDRSDQADNTLVVLWGDHGEFIGDHQLLHKYDTAMYDCLLRVPLIFRGPGIPAGAMTDTFVQSVDILPTIAEICGVEIPTNIHGRSFLPTLCDPKKVHREYAYAQSGYDDAILADLPEISADSPYYPKNRAASETPQSLIQTEMIRTKDWKQKLS